MSDMSDPLLLSKEKPELSAKTPIMPAQAALLVLGSISFLVLAWYKPWETAKAFVLFCTVFYLAFSMYKLLLVRRSVSRSAEIQVSEDELRALPAGRLPEYSIIVPMYREADSFPRIVEALGKLDYPAEKLDVQLVLEEDDDETRSAAGGVALPGHMRVTLVPASLPRTKPKACNVALARARGKYTVIYDAEDRPDPDQLRKAVVAFSRVGSEVICLQSKLNFYNPRQNLLARWFTAEYSAWFDLFLPGLSAMNAVIPLGGTSNHFVTARLKDLMGWDAYNVTEDCDLGIRIYRAGFRSRMLGTTTWEEACCSLSFWIRQRTRWLKGYIQTYLVHMRNPFRLFRDLGASNFVHFHALIAGIVFCSLINPLYWALAAAWFVLRIEALVDLFPLPVFAAGALCLFAGNFVFLYVGALGCFKRRYYDLVKYSLIAPFYWLLMSFSGWRAFLQFFGNPFLWEKTRHGMFK